ncbi:MAG: DUF3108 domain-containing protein [Fibrobacterales bacterium]|nr:DUF3108 domain-containing protein [Fibrobacterales bacterium]
MRRLLHALVLLCVFSAAFGEEAKPGVPGPGAAFPAGEVLQFDIRWAFVRAGRAAMVADLDRGSPRVRAYAWNNGAFETVYPVSDTIEAVLDPATRLPKRFDKINNEGSWHSRSHIAFDQAALSAHLSDTAFDGSGVPRPGRSVDTTIALDGPSHDILSAFYLFRTLPLEVGKTHTFNAVSGKKKYAMKVLVHRRERVEVPAGTFDCVVVEPILADDGLFKAKGTLTIWLTDDADRVPVLVKSKIALGSIKVELTSRRAPAGR